MQVPPIPADEAARLAELHSLNVLDTPPSPALDAIVRLASKELGVPTSLVSLVDERRQWFKARVGLDATETSREISFCGHVVATGEPMVVTDAQADPRFFDNPLVTSAPYIRFYVGFPLITSKGFVLGTLCVIDSEVHRPSREQLDTLRLLATVTSEHLEAQRASRQAATERAYAVGAAHRYRTLFEVMSEGVIVYDKEGRPLTMNAAALQILGLSEAEVLSQRVDAQNWSVIAEDGGRFPMENHPARLAISQGITSRNVVVGVNRKDDTLVWISCNAVPLPAAEAGPSAIFTFQDITLIKQAHFAREQLRTQERLVTAGTLAAGVGHEINNPLTYILANLEYAVEEVRGIAGGSPSSRLRELGATLSEARQGALRIKDIVAGLRALARQDADATSSVLDKVVQLSSNIARHEVRPKATLKVQLEPTPPLAIDESRLSQVLVNLLVNAAQAFHDKDVERNQITLSGHQESESMVRIAVSDNGPGIPSNLLGRIFDPFFTTKAVGEGTGLGLPICHGIVTSLGGTIAVSSSVGKGTTFLVRLPIALVLPETAAPSEAPRGIESRIRVLVIDDDELVGRSIVRVLSRDSDVTHCTDALVGLAKTLQDPPYDIVFCDLTMPHLHGDELYRKVQQQRPEMAERFVFITGSSDEPRFQQFLSSVENERLDKPLDAHSLRAVTRRRSKR